MSLQIVHVVMPKIRVMYIVDIITKSISSRVYIILINLNNVDLMYGIGLRTTTGLINWQYFWLVFFITIKKTPPDGRLEHGTRANPVSLFGRSTTMWLVVYIEGLLFQTSRWFR